MSDCCPWLSEFLNKFLHLSLIFSEVEVLSTITREERKLFVKLHEVKIKGSAQIVVAIKIAHLALRHRQNRNQKMRIIMFIGSPIEGIDKANVGLFKNDFSYSPVCSLSNWQRS